MAPSLINQNYLSWHPFYTNLIHHSNIILFDADNNPVQIMYPHF